MFSLQVLTSARFILMREEQQILQPASCSKHTRVNVGTINRVSEPIVPKATYLFGTLILILHVSMIRSIEHDTKQNDYYFEITRR